MGLVNRLFGMAVRLGMADSHSTHWPASRSQTILIRQSIGYMKPLVPLPRHYC